MSKFIEEFYYGNIDSQAKSTKQNQTVQKQMEARLPRHHRCLEMTIPQSLAVTAPFTQGSHEALAFCSG